MKGIAALGSILLLGALFLSCQSGAHIVSTEVPAASSASALDQNTLWDHNYSCIFDNYRTFSYLHIGYVPYFNISGKIPIYATTDECLDTCTADCSCAAVVYDVPHDSCYQYHDYITVQSIQLVPVQARDTISAYIKIQRGYDRNRYYYSPAAATTAPRFMGLLLLLACFLPVF